MQGGDQSLAQLSAKIFENGDFCLTEAEKKMVEKVKAAFPRVAVVLNVGGMLDTSWFKEDEKNILCAPGLAGRDRRRSGSSGYFVWRCESLGGNLQIPLPGLWKIILLLKVSMSLWTM